MIGSAPTRMATVIGQVKSHIAHLCRRSVQIGHNRK